MAVEKIGNIIYLDTNITIDDTKSDKLRDITLEKKKSAHIAVYYVGNSVQKTTYGHSGCIGCVCRPDWRIKTRSGWTPNGRDPEFKLLSQNQTMKLSKLAFIDEINEDKFCIDHRNFGLAAQSCK